MNSDESHFRELVNEAPFDNSYRDEHREQLRLQALAAFDASQANRSRRPGCPYLNWRHFISRPAPRFAAILLVAITFITVLSVMFRTQSTIAFDKLVGPILTAKTARFNTAVEASDLPKQVTRTLVFEPSRLRQEMPSGQIIITDSNAGTSMVLMPQQKLAMLVNVTDMPKEKRPVNYLDHLRTNLQTVAKEGASKRVPLGRKQIDGRDAVGFQVTESHSQSTIWGDPETGLPILVEMQIDMLPDAKITMTDFEFDIELDQALFKIVPPEGYSLQEVNLTTPTEKDVISALKLLSDSNNGQFPDTFDMMAIQACVISQFQKNPGQLDAAGIKKRIEQSLPLNQGLTFAATLPKESNARYAGKGVKLGAEDAPVFWYQPVGASAYRVIFADLSVKEQDSAPVSAHAVPVTLHFNPKELTTDAIKRLRSTLPNGDLPLPESPEPPNSFHELDGKLKDNPAKSLDDPAARQIIDQMAKVYANCKTYRDSGVARAVHSLKPNMQSISERPFTTAFVRSGKFRFEFKDMHYLIAGRPACYFVWTDGKEVQTWWDIKPGIQKPESLGLALGGATGVSKGSAATIPALLLPGEVWGSITGISGAKLADDGHVGAYECFRIEGTYGRNPMTIWIDKKSHLIRRIDNRFENLSIEQTTTYEPILDEQIPDELLEFNPPAEY